MNVQFLYSLILQIMATADTSIPATTGHQTHALFLDLVKQIDPALSAQLHDDPQYRPFTVSALRGAPERDGILILQAGHTYQVRITLLDGGILWQGLSAQFLAARITTLRLGSAEFLLQSVLTTPESDPSGWACYTDWQTLATAIPSSLITLRFASPCAFSLGDRTFALYPEPLLVWDSLMRSWNRYAPEVLLLDKQLLREHIKANVSISDYQLHTTTLSYPKSPQKGFTGTCTYTLKKSDAWSAHLNALAHYAHYCGIGYKTTMGMGQTRLEKARKDHANE